MKKNELIGYSLDELLTKSYGIKGTASRKKAEEKIIAIAENLSIANTIKEIRESRNKSQHQIASAMNVDDSVISKLEQNFKKAQLSTIMRYAKALGCKKTSLIFEFTDTKFKLILK